MSQGKGDQQRPLNISKKEWDRNYNRVFCKHENIETFRDNKSTDTICSDCGVIMNMYQWQRRLGR